MASRSIPNPPVDPAQQSLIGALTTGFRILQVLMIVLIVAYAASGVFRVQAGEQGVIVRLGRLLINRDAASPNVGTHVFDPGWQFALPDPLDEKIRLPGRSFELKIETFVFKRSDEDKLRPLNEISRFQDALRPGEDGAMITGDNNLCHGLWTVQYRITDAGRFVTRIGETAGAGEPVLQRLAESTILREISWRRFEDVTRGESALVAAAVLDRLRRNVETMDIGLTVDKVAAEIIEPLSVRQAFTQVSAAENEKKQLEDEARSGATQRLNETAGPQHAELLARIRRYGAQQAMNASAEDLARLRAEIDAALDRAGGRVATMLRNAASEASEIRERIAAEFKEYTYLLEQHRKYPVITRLSLWNLMRERVLQAAQNEIFFVPHTRRLEIIINRDPDKQQAAQIQALERSQGR